MFPERIAEDDIELVLKELRLLGEVRWDVEDEDQRILRIDDSFKIYKRDGNAWVFDGYGTMGRLMADYIREKMNEPSKFSLLMDEVEE